MTNWKTFTITGKEVNYSNNWIGFYLNGCVIFSDDKRCKVFTDNVSPFNDYCEGDKIEVDLDVAKYYSFRHNFNINSFRNLSVGEIIRSTPNQNQVSTMVRRINASIDSDERNRYTASMEVNPKTGSVAYSISGERKW